MRLSGEQRAALFVGRVLYESRRCPLFNRGGCIFCEHFVKRGWFRVKLAHAVVRTEQWEKEAAKKRRGRKS